LKKYSSDRYVIFISLRSADFPANLVNNYFDPLPFPPLDGVDPNLYYLIFNSTGYFDFPTEKDRMINQ